MVNARGVLLAYRAGNTVSWLVACALVMVFFIYLFGNIAMVSDILPVVCVTRALVSYGGTSAITLMAGFGIIMSMGTHKAW